MPKGAIYVGRPTLWGNPFTLADALCIAHVTKSEAPTRRRPALPPRARTLMLSDYDYHVSVPPSRGPLDQAIDVGVELDRAFVEGQTWSL